MSSAGGAGGVGGVGNIGGVSSMSAGGGGGGGGGPAAVVGVELDQLALQSTAPECLLGSEHTQASATLTWSLGVLLHVMLTGEPPFSGRSAPQLLQQVFAGMSNTDD